MDTTTTSRQQRVIDRVLHYYKRYTIGNHPELWTMTHEVSHHNGFLSLTVRVTRTDCEPASPRAVFCNDGGHFMITRRGKLTIGSSYALVGDRKKEERHLAFMLNGSVFGSSYRPWTASRRRREIKTRKESNETRP